MLIVDDGIGCHRKVEVYLGERLGPFERAVGASAMMGEPGRPSCLLATGRRASRGRLGPVVVAAGLVGRAAAPADFLPEL